MIDFLPVFSLILIPVDEFNLMASLFDWEGLVRLGGVSGPFDYFSDDDFMLKCLNFIKMAPSQLYLILTSN